MQVLVGGSGFIAPRILAGRRPTSNVWLNRVHTKVASTPSEREEGHCMICSPITPIFSFQTQKMMETKESNAS